MKEIRNPAETKPSEHEGIIMRSAAENCKEYLDNYSLNADMTCKVPLPEIDEAHSDSTLLHAKKSH